MISPRLTVQFYEYLVRISPIELDIKNSKIIVRYVTNLKLINSHTDCLELNFDCLVSIISKLSHIYMYGMLSPNQLYTTVILKLSFCVLQKTGTDHLIIQK